MATNNLPPIDQKAVESTTPSASNGVLEVMPSIDFASDTGPTSKDIAIGVGALLVLAIVFVFIRQGYVNWLVSSHKRAPNSAGLAGWGLFGALFFGSAIGCIGLVNKSLFALPYIVPLAVLSVICLVICILSSRKT